MVIIIMQLTFYHYLNMYGDISDMSNFLGTEGYINPPDYNKKGYAAISADSLIINGTTYLKYLTDGFDNSKNNHYYN